MTPNNTLFISYAREDADFALRLAKDLRAAGVAIWIDQLDIPTGARWDRAVQTALENCARFLIILSPASTASENVQDELALALDENKIIVPVLYRECKTPLRLRRLQRIDFTQDYRRGLKKLLEDISRAEEKPVARVQEEPRPAPEPRPEPQPVRQTEKQPEPRPAPTVPTSFPQPNQTAFAWQRYAGAFAVIAGLVLVIWKGIDWEDSASQDPPVTKKAEDSSATQRQTSSAIQPKSNDPSSVKKQEDTPTETKRENKPAAPSTMPERSEQPRIRPKPEGMVYIPAGEFMMGDDNGEDDEKPAHRVRVNAFYLDQYEVTVAQFRKFILATNYKTEAEKSGGSYVWEATDWKNTAGANWKRSAEGNYAPENHPVIHVSWNDAKAYAAWAKKRLPTEAEWEYACRSGSKNYKYAWGNGDPAGKNGGNIADETAKQHFSHWTIWKGYRDGYIFTAPVGSFNPNMLGLYDMAGNVWEWCEDPYDAKYYRKRNADNPKGPNIGEYRVLRGGAWSLDPLDVRGASRFRLHASDRFDFVGFRCAQDVFF